MGEKALLSVLSKKVNYLSKPKPPGDKPESVDEEHLFEASPDLPLSYVREVPLRGGSHACTVLVGVDVGAAFLRRFAESSKAYNALRL